MFSDIINALPSVVPFRAPEAQERDWNVKYHLRLGANENLWGPCPSAVAASKEVLQEVYKYNDPEAYDLRQKLATHYGLAAENFVFGEGIDGLLGLCVRTLINPGDTVVTSLGSYPTFDFHARGYGANLVRVPYDQSKPHLEGLLDAAKKNKAKLIYLANPDNPSGYFHKHELIEAFLSELPEDVVLLLDEAYSEFVEPQELIPITSLAPNLIRMRTFSKAYGLAGLRVGYGITSKEFVDNLDKVRLHFGVNMVGQVVCHHALEDAAWINKVREETRLGREHYEKIGHSLNLDVLPSSTNFVAMNVGSKENSLRLLELLAEKGVFVRRSIEAPLEQCIRVTVAPQPQREEFGRIMTLLFEKNYKNSRFV